MAKKKLTLGMAAAAAAGTAVYVAKKSQDKKNQNGTSQNDIRDKANSSLPKYFYNFPYFTGFLAYSLVK